MAFPTSSACFTLAQSAGELEPDRLIAELLARLPVQWARDVRRTGNRVSFPGSVVSAWFSVTRGFHTACSWITSGEVCIDDSGESLQVSYRVCFRGAFWLTVISGAILIAMLTTISAFVDRTNGPLHWRAVLMLLSYLPLLAIMILVLLVFANWRFHHFVKRCIRKSGGTIVATRRRVLH